MGFFDLLNPAFDVMDRVLAAALGPGLRLAVWALLGAFASMFLYRLCSRQEALAELKPRIKEAQRQLANFDGDFDEILPLIRRSLGLSLKQFGMALGPALLASIPLIFLLVWLSNRYDLATPEPGDPVPVVAIGASSELSLQGAVSAGELEAGDRWLLTWPEQPATAKLLDARGEVWAELPPEQLSPVIHKRQWWNALIGNPAGYLADGAPLDAVELQIPTRQYLPWGAGWMRGWEFLFIGLLFAFSVAIKVLFRIH